MDPDTVKYQLPEMSYCLCVCVCVCVLVCVCVCIIQVRVDPDTVKYQLPEMSYYIQRNPGPNPSKDIILAGHATHNESAFIEVLLIYVYIYVGCRV